MIHLIVHLIPSVFIIRHNLMVIKKNFFLNLWKEMLNLYTGNVKTLTIMLLFLN